MKILCYGSLNLDYVYQVEHIVQPGETIMSHSFQLFSGGKGMNQAIALGRANAACSMAGMIGRDGVHLVEGLKESGVEAGLVTVSENNTGHAIIQVDKKGQNSILYFPGANRKIDNTSVQQALGHFTSGDYVLLQNEINNIPYIMEQAKGKGMKIAFNPSPITAGILDYPLHLVDLMIMNEIEGFEITGEKVEENILKKMHERYPDTVVILTLGKKGALYSDGVNLYRHGIYDVKVLDTTAAGDTFTGYFLASHAGGDPVDVCLRKASIASSIAVSRHGASDSIPYLHEVETSGLPLAKA